MIDHDKPSNCGVFVPISAIRYSSRIRIRDQLHINCISYQLHIIPTTYQLHINYISTTYQLYIYYIYINYISNTATYYLLYTNSLYQLTSRKHRSIHALETAPFGSTKGVSQDGDLNTGEGSRFSHRMGAGHETILVEWSNRSWSHLRSQPEFPTRFGKIGISQ